MEVSTLTRQRGTREANVPEAGRNSVLVVPTSQECSYLSIVAADSRPHPEPLMPYPSQLQQHDLWLQDHSAHALMLPCVQTLYQAQLTVAALQMPCADCAAAVAAVGKQQSGLALAELKLNFGAVGCVAGEPVSAALQLWTAFCICCPKQAKT